MTCSDQQTTDELLAAASILLKRPSGSTWSEVSRAQDSMAAMLSLLPAKPVSRETDANPSVQG